MKFSAVILSAALLLGGCGESSGPEEWPGSRPIQVVCFTSPGGDTDVVNRTLGQAMEAVLGTRVNVINKPGAHGGNAMRDVWSRRHDGYRWTGVSANILIAPVMNGHQTTAKDWTYFIVGGSPGVISVAADSPYRTLTSLMAAAQAKPRGINAAASSTGGVWHVQLAMLERAAGVTFNFVPYEGSHPSQLALLSGEVEVVLTSLAEQAELIRGGKLRPLAAIQNEPLELPGGETIPSVATWYPAAAETPVSQWLGFGLPVDTPPEVLAKIDDAFHAAMQSAAIEEFLSTRLMQKFGWSRAEADTRVRKTERAWTWALQDLGIAEISPEEVGIERP